MNKNTTINFLMCVLYIHKHIYILVFYVDKKRAQYLEPLVILCKFKCIAKSLKTSEMASFLYKKLLLKTDQSLENKEKSLNEINWISFF